jgi:hypothetical protein
MPSETTVTHLDENDLVSLKAPRITKDTGNNDVHVPKMKPEGGLLSCIYHYVVAIGRWALFSSFVAVFGPVIQKSYNITNLILETA